MDYDISERGVGAEVGYQFPSVSEGDLFVNVQGKHVRELG